MTRMHSAAELLALLSEQQRTKELENLSDEALAALQYDWQFWARPDQIAPVELDQRSIWAILAGRGWGKTRTGAEWVKDRVENHGAKRIALVAETAADARDVMVEGPAGLLACYPVWHNNRPFYEPSKRRLTWPNGAIATLFNATEPGQLRGPQHDLGWSDELAKWRYAREAWDMLQFGMRLGSPKQLVTTTPRGIPIIREIVGDHDCIVTRGSTLDNANNLAPQFLQRVRTKYEGTRLGRQELYAEILDDLPGALWARDGFDRYRVTEPPPLERVVVAIDPAITSMGDSEEPGTHGIVAAGKGQDGRGYVLQDGSIQGTPNEWARRAVAMFREHSADLMVAEVNQGGDMVVSTVQTVAPQIYVKKVRATRGKHVRAEPISGLYEQGRISHIGAFPDLEDQLCDFTSAGYEGEGSPDRADALVWAMTELFGDMVHHADDEPPPPPPESDPWGDDEEADAWKLA